MGDQLRGLLIAAKLAGTKDNGNNGSYLFRSNEGAADVAVAVVQQWLRAEAAKARLVFARVGEPYDMVVEALDILADDLGESR